MMLDSCHRLLFIYLYRIPVALTNTLEEAVALLLPHSCNNRADPSFAMA